MKRIKSYIFIAVVLLLAVLPFFCTSAAPIVEDLDSLNRTISASSFDDSNTFTFEEDITSLVKNKLGENSGTISISFNHTAPIDAGVTYEINYVPGTLVSADDTQIKVEISFTVSEKSLLTDFEITDAKLTITPSSADPSFSPGVTDETITPTPEGQTPGPDDVTPTPEGQTPETTTPAPPSSSIITEITPSPTRRPTPTPEKIEDNYIPASPNPTPTIPPELSIDTSDLPTPVPELETPKPLEKVSSSPTLSFMPIFIVLVLLLVLDLFLIYWRKQMGCGTLINNGISRRKVRDDLVNTPENTQPSDIEEVLDIPPEEDANQEEPMKESETPPTETEETVEQKEE